ncbi:hypothetical protein C8C83_3449 [Flavobacterium sp. 90]|uniref:hypothetical protein n=1 Tax=unclassified Flavobacterium TaxID=196869 RepID=UPI000EAF700D|nr:MULTISPECIES: hypothetical protein [unclassified Flavobacterium]RKR11706.1 hypothetical protein C8C82_3767 [Flavobacterium sp. 81]TCK55481.1 hypothetical protein C8C83_3449 [Flavobacterium sp. 90]
MKSLRLLFIALFFVSTHSYSQVQVDKITYNGRDHYITTTIGYPVPGTFSITGQKEPTTVLNPDGTGVIQSDDLSKKKINWGIECTEEGIPVFKEGFNSASYTFWYRNNDSDDWIYSQFSIHFAKKKMFLMGERVKEYVDYNVQ